MIIKNDGTLDIALGRNREETRWQNKEMLWSAIVKKLAITHRSAETYAEYMKMKPGRQDNIKDIGGFVGGLISGGRRKAKSIIHRQLLTLDLDYAESQTDFWDNVMLMDCAACAYSTHKHSIASPRLRLIVPLSRPVNPEEYEAIARKFAAHINIEWFDPTTFQPSRLMYWPSSSKDADFYSNFIDAQWLDADSILKQYHDWQDSSQWPVSSKAKDKIKSDIKEQNDPLVKSGLIGAWCRTYSIQEVIEQHLSDIYIKSDTEDRWTYINGSTANGLVVYMDKFAYSHHSTDPISEKLCNAWDLVRIHKFKHLDEKHESTAIGAKLPSFVAMSDFVAQDKLTRRTIGEEKLVEAQAAFADVAPETEQPIIDLIGNEWMEEMEVDKLGNYLPTINNIVLVLENDPGLKNCFRLNEFEHRETIAKDLPWRKVGKRDTYMTDTDASNLRHYLELIYGINSVLKIDDALAIVQRRHMYHPVREYLEACEWDDIKRAETIMIRYLGAADTDYIKGVTRKWLLACVTRIMEPGCKFDELIVIVGDQGIGKSTLIRKLGGKWFSDSFTTVQGKDALEQLQGAWIIEMPELSAMRKAEVEQVKHFTGKQEDRFRVAYGKRIENFPRQCIFAGTTNNENFLKDLTGNRRFWPITTDMERATENLFNQLDKDTVKLIWAEVMTWYMMGEHLHLEGLLKMDAEEVVKLHMELDERIGALQVYLDTPVPSAWPDLNIYARRAFLQSDAEDIVEQGTVIRNQICAAEVWCELLNGSMKDLNTFSTKDVHGLLRRIEGWSFTGNYKRVPIYGRQKIYIRTDTL
jgi:putative DNA primase/helicase